MATKSKTNKYNHKNNSSISILELATLFIITLFIILAPFQMGFFNGTGLHSFNQYAFEEKVLYGIMFGLISLLVVSLHFFRKTVIESRHLLAIAGAVLPLVYWISSWNAQSTYLSQISILLYITFYAFYLLGLFLASSKLALHYLKQFFIFSGYLIVFYGFMILFGVAYVNDALSFDVGVRLASVFTYSNANAVFLLVLLVAILLRLTTPIKRIEFYVHVFMLVPIVSSFLMTLSRSGMIMLPIIGLVILFMVNVRRQVALLGFLIGSVAISFAILSDLSKRGTDTFEKFQAVKAAQQSIETNSLFSAISLGGLLWLATASLVMGLLVYVCQRFITARVNPKLNSMSTRKGSRFIIPCSMVILSILGFGILRTGLLTSVLPEGISGRLDNFSLETHSVIERITLYEDAIKMWKETPLLGGGGGAWEASYERYQTYPYLNAQTHSYPVQLLVEIGLIGLVLISLFIGYIIIRYLRYYFQQSEDNQESSLLYFLAAASILIHSLIDFEMSYAYMGVLVFMSLGVLAGVNSRKIEGLDSSKLAKPLRISFGGGLLVVAVLSMYISIGSLNTVSDYKESINAASQQKPIEHLLKPLYEGLDKKPGNPFLLDQVININIQAYEQSKQEQYLTEVKQKLEQLKTAEPNYKNLAVREYSIALIEGNREEAVKVLEHAIEDYPYELNYYEQIVMDRLSLWQEHKNSGRLEDVKLQEDALFNIVAKVQDRIAHLDSLSEVTIYIRKFEMTPNMYLAAGLVHFHRGSYQEAINVMLPGRPGALDTDTNKNIALYYLASLKKQGQDDAELYENLVAVDPTMADRLESLFLEITS